MSTFATQVNALKCSRRGCHLPPSYLPLPCANQACNKAMHLVCCQKFVFGVHSLQPLISPVPGSHAITCTKKCYFKVAKNQNTTSSTRTVPTHLAVSNNTVPTHLAIPDNTRLPWNRDGQNGPQDPNHSEAILIDWLTTPGNYEKYRGSGNGGRRKIHFATMISSKIKDAGVRKPRTPKDVQNKIEYVEKCFRSAHDWAHTETGEGLRESDTGTYEEALLRKCPWYFDILEIFEDRANARPLHTTEDMFQQGASTDDDDGSNVNHCDSNVIDLNKDDETEDEEDDVKLAPVAPSLFRANDGAKRKQRYSPLEPSLFAREDGEVDDADDDTAYRYDYDDAVDTDDKGGGQDHNRNNEHEKETKLRQARTRMVPLLLKKTKQAGKKEQQRRQVLKQTIIVRRTWTRYWTPRTRTRRLQFLYRLLERRRS